MLLGGIIGGLSLAGFGALRNENSAQRAMPPGAIAMVNNNAILRADFVRALTAVSAGKRNPVSKDDEAAILQRLIEEELLVQHALRLGMIETDTSLRNSLVSTLTRDVIARSRARAVTDEALKSYYQNNREPFVRGSRYFIAALLFSGPGANAKMAEFDAARTSGKSLAQLLKEFAANTIPVPQGLVPKQKLLDYLGPEPVRSLDNLDLGSWSLPIATGNGNWRLLLLEKTQATEPDWQEIKPQVMSAYLDERDSKALRIYINQLKKRADISLQQDSF